MSGLKSRQRALLATLKGRPLATADCAEARRLERTAHCVDLLREIVLWWRDLGIARACPMTTSMLKASAQFDRMLYAFVRETPGAADLGEQAARFLDYVARSDDALLRSVALTERALRASALDETFRAQIDWPCNPAPTLRHCLHGLPPTKSRRGRFVVSVGERGACSLAWRRRALRDMHATDQVS